MKALRLLLHDTTAIQYLGSITLTQTCINGHVADDSKNERRSSKLSPISSYACNTLDNSNPFITNSCTEAGYSSVVAKLFDA